MVVKRPALLSAQTDRMVAGWLLDGIGGSCHQSSSGRRERHRQSRAFGGLGLPFRSTELDGMESSSYFFFF